VFDAADLASAQEQLQRMVRKYEKPAPKLAAWLEKNVPEGLSVFALPASHRKRLRTTNMLELILPCHQGNARVTAWTVPSNYENRQGYSPSLNA
jgi:transposase-like protein